MRNKREMDALLKIGTCGIKIGDTIWCSDIRNNGLYKINVINHKIEFVDEFPVFGFSWLFSDIIVEKEKLFFIPDRACELVIYDMKDNYFEEIQVKNEEMERYGFGIIDSDILYLFPIFGKNIVKIDYKNKKVAYVSQMVEHLKHYFLLEDRTLFGAYYIYQKNIFLPLYERNVVVKYDYLSEKFKHYLVGKCENAGIMDCVGVAEILYLLDSYGTVYEFNLETENIKKVFSQKDNGIESYGFIEFYENELWLMPYKKDSIVIYDLIEDKISSFSIFSQEKRNESNADNKDAIKFTKVFYEDGKLWLWPYDVVNSIIEIDMKSRMIKEFIPYLPDDRVNMLPNFLRRLNRPLIGNEEIKNIVGKEIWNVIKV